MKNYLLTFLIICCLGGIVYAQAVSNILQERIQRDRDSIVSDYANANAMQQDIDNITNDNSAIEVTSTVPSIAEQVQELQVAQNIKLTDSQVSNINGVNW